MPIGNENKCFVLRAAFEGDQITVFTVTSRSPCLLVKKEFLYIIGDATSQVHTVQEKGFILFWRMLECQMPASMWTTMGLSNLVGRGVAYEFSLKADFTPGCIKCPLSLVRYKCKWIKCQRVEFDRGFQEEAPMSMQS